MDYPTLPNYGVRNMWAYFIFVNMEQLYDSDKNLLNSFLQKKLYRGFWKITDIFGEMWVASPNYFFFTCRYHRTWIMICMLVCVIATHTHTHKAGLGTASVTWSHPQKKYERWENEVKPVLGGNYDNFRSHFQPLLSFRNELLQGGFFMKREWVTSKSLNKKNETFFLWNSNVNVSKYLIQPSTG